jgi:hypothetical protein
VRVRRGRSMTRQVRVAAALAGFGLIVAGATSARAQTAEMNAFGGYQAVPPPGVVQSPVPPPGVVQSPAPYTVAPSLPGTGGTYNYVQQNPGAGVGMSPSTYYSRNFFTRTPMSNVYYYGSGYGTFTTSNATPTPNATPTYAVPAYPYAAAPGYSSRTTPTYSYGTTTYAYPTYTTARRGGPLRWLFGGR